MAVIDVKQGMTIVNGTALKDQINLKLPVGDGIVIKAEAGNDVITVNRGDNHIIQAGEGNDFITVASGKNYQIDLGEGDDRLDIFGASGHQVIAVSGTNNININSGSRYAINGGTGIDKLTIKGTNSYNTAYLGRDNDILIMATGSYNNLYGGEGNDYFIVSGGSAGKLYGDEDNDTIRLYGGQHHTVYAGTGDDAMLITEANYSKVYGVAGKNQVMFFGGSGNVYYGGAEKDNITIKHLAQGVKVIGGDKATVVNIQAGNNHIIDLSAGNNSVTQIMTGKGTRVKGGIGKDTLKLWGDVEELTADLGDGNDVVNVKDGTKLVLAGGSGDDVFQVSGGNIKNLEFGQGEDSLSIIGGTIDNLKLGSGHKTISGNSVADGTLGSIGTISGTSVGDVLTISGKVDIDRIDLASGSDRLIVKGDQAHINNLRLSFGADEVILYGGKIDTISYGSDSNYLELAGIHDFTTCLSTGNDKVKITVGNNLEVDGGSGNEEMQVDGGSNITLYGNSGSDKFQIAGGAQVIAKGGQGSDEFILSEGEDVTLEGNEGDDTITVSGGVNGNLDGGEGDDTFYLKGGLNHKVYGGEGRNNFSVTGGSGWELEALQGDNTVVMRAGTVNKMALGAGTNTLNMQGGSIQLLELSVAVANNINQNGGYISCIIGNEQVNVLSLTGNMVDIGKIDLEQGDNTFSIEARSTVEVEQLVLGDGNNQLNFKAGKINQLSVGSGDNSLNLDGVKEFEAHLGAGNDTITISSGNKLKVAGERGNDVFDITGGTDIIVQGDAGEDIITISGGSNVIAYGGEDDDTIYVSGTGNTVYGNEGEDHIIVKAATKAVLYGGADQDFLEVEDSTLEMVELGEGEDFLLLNNTTVNTLHISEGLDKIEGHDTRIKEILAKTSESQLELSGKMRVEKLNLDKGQNTLVLKDQVELETLNLGSANNTIDWYGGNIYYLQSQAMDGEANHNTINFRGVKDTKLNTYRGYYELNIYEGSGLNLRTDLGNNYIRIFEGSDIEINTIAGTNTIEINGGTNIKAKSECGSTIYISGGKDLTYTGSSYEDQIFITGGQDININAASGMDLIDISGGQNIEVRGNGSQDRFIISGGDQVRVMGESGSDSYLFKKLQANCSYIVDEANSSYTDLDYLDLTAFKREDFVAERQDNRIILTHGNGATITINNWNPQMTMSVKFADTEQINVKRLVTPEPDYIATSQAEVIQNLLNSMAHSSKFGYEALEEAVNKSSMGRFDNFTAMVNEFKQTILDAHAVTYQQAKDFLKEYCGIDLNNKDTGSILGYDCGGLKELNSIDVIAEPEGTTLADFIYDNSRTITEIDYITGETKEFYAADTNCGITLYWNEDNWDKLSVSRSILEQLVGGLVNVWIPAAVKHIETAYGLSLTSEDCGLYKMEDGTRGIQIDFDYSTSNSSIATAGTSYASADVKSRLWINTKYFAKPITQVDGNSSSSSSTLFDRILTHELTHTATYTNMNFYRTPKFIVEGLAELVHGIDDFRTSSIVELVQTSFRAINADTGESAKTQAESLDMVYNLDNYLQRTSFNMTYSGGYDLLRYYAKQVMDYATAMSDSSIGESLTYYDIDSKQKLIAFGSN